MAPIAAAKAGRKTILVVEDDLEMIKLHLNFLSGRFTVVVKSSGIKALEYLRKHRPVIHLAIIDVMLPDLSGIEVLREIKKLMPLVPTIVLTAYGSEDVAVNAFRCGARDYVKKPFNYAELLKRIDLCLSPGADALPENGAAAASGTVPEGRREGAEPVRNHHIRQALQFIRNNLSADIGLDQAAGVARVSRYHFSRLFKEVTGVTYRSYVNRLRIERAGKLLDDDALSITEVGLASGYSDLTHFERIFKRIVGVTPSQYRRRKSG